jgi:hypothetical protein
MHLKIMTWPLLMMTALSARSLISNCSTHVYFCEARGMQTQVINISHLTSSYLLYLVPWMLRKYIFAGVERCDKTS